jgi:intein/homing endonuclease/replicative DNA helicase
MALASVNADNFEYRPAKEVYERAVSITKKKGEIPSWKELLTDPAISESIRKRLREDDRIKPIKTREKLRARLHQLEEYRQLRTLAFMAEHIAKKLKKDKVNLERLKDHCANELTRARTFNGDSEDDFTNIGQDDKVLDVVDDILEGKNLTFIPTGCKTHDRTNQGWARGSLVMLAATTGGGKSALAKVIQKNQSRWGARTCLVSLEMERDEVMIRELANLSRVSMSKLINPKEMSDEEKNFVKKKFRKHHKRLKEMGAVETIYNPKDDLAIEELLMLLKPYDFDVIFVDYISLLKGMDEEEQWRKLGSAARYGKIFAKNNHCIVVLLAQLSQEGIVRYSKAMQEHCLSGDTWVDTPNGLIQIQDMLPNATKGDYPLKQKVISENTVHESTWWYHNGIKPTYTVTTHRGFEITATGNHKFKVLKDDKIVWRELSDLRKDDLIAFNVKSKWPTKQVTLPSFNILPKVREGYTRKYTLQPCKIPTKVNQNFARLVGYLITDGCIRSDGITFVNGRLEVIKDFQSLFRKVFGINLPIKNRGKYWLVTSYNRTAIEFLLSIDGICNNARKKTIPAFIMRSPLKVAAACIGAMINSDGNCDAYAAKFFSTSKDMVKRLQLLLYKIGIDSNVLRVNTGKHKHAYWSKYSSKAIQWHMNISGLENVKVFDKYIRLCKDKTYKRIAAYSRPKRINTIVKGLKWQRVKYIKPAGKQPVYDITVPKTGTMVANGFSISNSNNFWAWTYNDEAKQTGIIEVRQLKARNQKAFTFQLMVDFDTMQIKDIDEDALETNSKKKKNIEKEKKKKRNKDYEVSDDGIIQM